MTPSERRLRAQIAAHTRWANCDDRRAATEAARRGLADKYERQVDPDGCLDPVERATRAAHARKADLLRASLARHR